MYSPTLEYKEHRWAQNLFIVTEKSPVFLSPDYELIEITSDTQLKAKFEGVLIEVFWGNLLEEYPEISIQAIKILL